jgi:hypothetical protein
MNVPRPIVVLIPVGTGDKGVWNRSRPDFRRHKAIRPTDSPWPVKQGIPSQLDRAELIRRAQEWRETMRPQTEALKAASQATPRAA